MKSSIISEAVRKTHWWMERQQELRALARETLPLLVYNEEILNETFFDLLAVGAVERVFQPVGVAPHPLILRKAWELGAGFQCKVDRRQDQEATMRLFEKCPVCGGELVEKEVEKLLKGGSNTAFLRVIAEVCLHCGERLYRPETVAQFEDIRKKLAADDVAEFEPVGRTYQVASEDGLDSMPS